MRFVSSFIAGTLTGISRSGGLMGVVLHSYAVFRQPKPRLARTAGRCASHRTPRASRVGVATSEPLVSRFFPRHLGKKARASRSLREWTRSERVQPRFFRLRWTKFAHWPRFLRHHSGIFPENFGNFLILSTFLPRRPTFFPKTAGMSGACPKVCVSGFWLWFGFGLRFLIRS